jgi:WD40 repeat protein
MVRLWDSSTGKELRTMDGPTQGVWDVVFSADGKFLAGSGYNSTICLCEVATGKVVRQFKGHTDIVRVLDLQGDILISGDESTLRVWDVSAGTEQHVFNLNSRETPLAVALSPDGRIFAIAVEYGATSIRNAQTGDICYRLVGPDGDFVNSTALAFSRDGTNLITTGGSGTCIWEVATGKQVAVLDRPVGTSLALDRSGKILAVGGSDGTIHIWDWVRRRELTQPARLRFPIESVSFSAGSKTLAAASDDGSAIFLWDIFTGQPQQPAPGHRGEISAVVCTPDSHNVITASLDGTVRFWDPNSGKETQQFYVADKDPEKVTISDTHVHGLVMSPDGKLLAALRGDGVTVIWDLTGEKEVTRMTASRVAFSQDSKWMAAAGYERDGDWKKALTYIRLVDTATFKPFAEYRDVPPLVHSVMVSADKRTVLAVCSKDIHGCVIPPAFLHQWNVATGKHRPGFAEVPCSFGVCLSPDGNCLAKEVHNKGIVFLETLTGRERSNVEWHGYSWLEMAFSPDNRLLAVMCDGVTLFDVWRSRQVGRLFGHRDAVTSVAFAPNGAYLVSASRDTTALVWGLEGYAGPQTMVPR